jgi:hypothetical protein
MKPLVLWCRWHNARLLLHGRDEQAVWGELSFPEQTERFRYELAAQELTIGAGDGARRVRLDEMGVERKQS